MVRDIPGGGEYAAVSRFKGFIRKNWFGIISICVSLFVMAFFIKAAGGFRSFVSAFGELDRVWLFLMFTCIAGFWLVDGFILHFFIRVKYKGHKYARSVRTTMLGLLYSSLTPLAVGGQPIQIYDMASCGIDAGDAASFATVKTILYQICLSAYAVTAMCFAFGFFRANVPGFGVFLGVALGLNTAFTAFLVTISVSGAAAEKASRLISGLLGRLRIISKRQEFAETVVKQIRLFNASLRVIYSMKGRLLAGFIFTVCQQTLYYCVPYCLYRSFGLSGQVFHMILSAQAVLTLITSFVPVSGGSGVAEGGFYLFFKMFFSEGALVPAVFIWRFTAYYLTILTGGAIALYTVWEKKLKKHKLKEDL